MSLEMIGIVVCLAHLALKTCKAAPTDKKEEYLRIGERLLNLMVLCKDWVQASKRLQQQNSQAAAVPSGAVLESLEKALTKLNRALQGDTLQKKRLRMQLIFPLQDPLEQVLNAEQDLNAVLQDVQVHQGNALWQQSNQSMQQMQARFDRIETLLLQMAQQQSTKVTTGQILEHLAAQKVEGATATFQEQINHVLQDCQSVLVAAPAVEDKQAKYTATTVAMTDTCLSTIDITTNLDNDSVEDPSVTISLDELDCDFSPASMIGEGAFAQVYRGQYQNIPVAIKRLKVLNIDVIKMTDRAQAREMRRLQAEAAFLQACGIHPHVTQCFGCHTAFSKTERPLIVMELMDTSLFMALHEGKIPTFAHRRNLLLGVASAMEFLHTRGIVHGDIKSANILLCGDELSIAKLADFGEAKEKGLATTHAVTMSPNAGRGGGVAGTMAYQAPEVLLQKVTETSRRSEIHTFGVVVWECLTGEIPHRNKNPIQLFLQAQDAKKETLLDIPEISPGFRDLDWITLRNVAKACMIRDAMGRPTASQAAAAIEEGPFYIFDNRNTPPVAVNTHRKLSGDLTVVVPPQASLKPHKVSCSLCGTEGDRISHLTCTTCQGFDLCKSCHANGHHGHHNFHQFDNEGVYNPFLLPAADSLGPETQNVSASAEGPFLTVHRRYKGKKALAWDVILNGFTVAQLLSEERLRIGRIKAGDRVAFRCGNGPFYVLVVMHVPQNLVIVLKPTSLHLGTQVYGLVAKQANHLMLSTGPNLGRVDYKGVYNCIDVCGGGNEDLQSGYIHWQGKQSEAASKLLSESVGEISPCLVRECESTERSTEVSAVIPVSPVSPIERLKSKTTAGMGRIRDKMEGPFQALRSKMASSDTSDTTKGPFAYALDNRVVDVILPAAPALDVDGDDVDDDDGYDC